MPIFLLSTLLMPTKTLWTILFTYIHFNISHNLKFTNYTNFFIWRK